MGDSLSGYGPDVTPRPDPARMRLLDLLLRIEVPNPNDPSTWRIDGQALIAGEYLAVLHAQPQDYADAFVLGDLDCWLQVIWDLEVMRRRLGWYPDEDQGAR